MFDASAGLVEEPGEESRLILLVGFVGYDRSYGARPCGGAVGLAGIAFVADGGTWRHVGSNVEQRDKMGRIRLLSPGQVEGNYGTRCI